MQVKTASTTRLKLWTPSKWVCSFGLYSCCSISHFICLWRLSIVLFNSAPSSPSYHTSWQIWYYEGNNATHTYNMKQTQYGIDNSYTQSNESKYTTSHISCIIMVLLWLQKVDCMVHYANTLHQLRTSQGCTVWRVSTELTELYFSKSFYLVNTQLYILKSFWWVNTHTAVHFEEFY